MRGPWLTPQKVLVSEVPDQEHFEDAVHAVWLCRQRLRYGPCTLLDTNHTMTVWTLRRQECVSPD